MSRRGRAGSGMDRHFKRPFPHPVAPSPPPAVPPARSRPAAAALDSSHRPLALRAEGWGRAAGWGLKRGGSRGNHHAPHENVTDVRHCRSAHGMHCRSGFVRPFLSNETGITSYSDETLTEEVGSKFHGCSGEHVLDGQRTAHGVATSSPGQRDELGEIDCSLNGQGHGARDICQAPLLEWSWMDRKVQPDLHPLLRGANPSAKCWQSRTTCACRKPMYRDYTAR